MITFNILVFIITIVLIIRRIKRMKKGIHTSFDVFEEPPNTESVILLIGMLYSLIASIILIIKYCP